MGMIDLKSESIYRLNRIKKYDTRLISKKKNEERKNKIVFDKYYRWEIAKTHFRKIGKYLVEAIINFVLHETKMGRDRRATF
jgi:hypothetical protein